MSQAFGRGAERLKIGNARANFGSLVRMSRKNGGAEGAQGRGEAEILGSAASRQARTLKTTTEVKGGAV